MSKPLPSPATLPTTPAVATLADFTAAPTIRDLDPDSPVLGSPRRFQRITAQAVYGAGVPARALAAFAQACCGTDQGDDDYAAMVLISYLHNLGAARGHLPLRDAINWCMVADQENWSTGYAVDEFAALGAAEQGWRFLAAGIEPDEARTILADTGGTIPVETLATMTALRGTTLPPDCWTVTG